MKLSFFPGDLHLSQQEDGLFIVFLNGIEVLRTKSQKVAVSRFNDLRRHVESSFPARNLTDEEKAEVLRQAIGDSLVGHNSLGGRKKKTSAGSTRTFGG